jgi:uridine phosphorylase
MSRRAWYIGCSEDEVDEAAILVGDRARIDRITEHLEAPIFLPENRGLRTVTGLRSGKRVTASAFGMGGPIAAIVLHELFDLGVRRFLRIGTAMVMPPAEVGDFVIADGAFRGEGTSRAYAPLGYPAVADFDLGVALRAALARRGRRWRAGLFGPMTASIRRCSRFARTTGGWSTRRATRRAGSASSRWTWRPRRS